MIDKITLKNRESGNDAFPYTWDSIVGRTGGTTVKDALDALEAGSTSREGYVIAKTTSDFMDENTIYEIRDEIDLGGNTLNIPANSVLKFEGGKLTNGTVKWEDTLLEGQVSMENIDVYEAPCSYRPIGSVWPNETESAEHKLANDVVYVDWFGTYGDGLQDDSKALVAAVKSLKRNGVTLAFGEGKTYLHGDGLTGDDGTGNQYTFVQYWSREKVNDVYVDVLEEGKCASDSTYISNYNQKFNTSITAAPATIGRKIRLDFNRFKSLKILGNGSTILSNPNNGIVFNNSMLDFYYCSGVCIENLTIDGNRTNRLAKLRTHWASLGHSEWQYYIDYSSGENYTVLNGIAMQGCSNISLNGVSAINSAMDNLIINGKTSNSMCRRVIIQNCQFKGVYRNSITLGGVDGVDVLNCYFEDNGIDGISPGNHIDVEVEVGSVSSGRKNYNIFIKNSHFIQNLQNSKIDGNTLQLRSKINFNTASDGPIVMENCIVTNSTFLSQSPNARISNCTFTNCRMNFGGKAVVDHCILNYTKELWKYTIDGTEYTVRDRDGSTALRVGANVIFTNNTVNWSTDLKKRAGLFMYLNGAIISNNIFNDLCGSVVPSGQTPYDNCEIGPNVKMFFGNILNAPADYNCESGEVESNFYFTIDKDANGKVSKPNPIYADNNYFDPDIVIRNAVSDRLNNIINSSSTATNNIASRGNTYNRPTNLVYPKDQGFEYYDTKLYKQIVFSPIIHNLLGSSSTSYQNSSKYISNPYEENMKGLIWFSYGNLAPHLEWDIKIIFSKNNTDYSSDDYISVDLGTTVYKVSNTTHRRETEVFTAPDPSVYPYIYLENNSPAALSLNFYELIDWWRNCSNHFTAARTKGTTDNRPTGIGAEEGVLNSLIDVGYEYFDTTLGKPIYASVIDDSTGEVTWVDSTGTTVS